MLGILTRFLAWCKRAMAQCVLRRSATPRTSLGTHLPEGVSDAFPSSLQGHTKLSDVVLTSGGVAVVNPDDSRHSSTVLGDRVVAMISGAAQGTDIVSELSPFRADEARHILDAFQLWVDENQQSPQYRSGIYLMMELSAASGELPSSLYLDGVAVGEEPVAYGGFADIYRGTYGTRDVAVKRLRFDPANSRRMYKLFYREVLIWRQLRHPHVLPFLGIDAHSFKKSGHLCMVSPWLAGGSLLQQIEEENYDINRGRLLKEVAEGLVYIHSQKVVHGDIHGRNVLLTATGSACLADFGIANIGDVTVGRPTITGHNAGAIRWMAPERFVSPEAELRKEVDIWAFACLCLMVYTFRKPFHDIGHEYTVILHVTRGQKPKRPGENECHGCHIPDGLWEVMTNCWSFEPHNRPSMASVLTRLQDTVFDFPEGSLDMLFGTSSPP